MARKSQEIFVRILQNGNTVAECVKPVKRGLDLAITPHYQGDLAIPFYPLTEDLTVFKMRAGRLYLSFDQPCSGFVMTRGGSLDVVSKGREPVNVPLGVDDYGSISFRDLRILFRVRRATKKRAILGKRETAYDPGPLPSLVFGREERGGFAMAAVLAFVFLASSFGIISATRSKVPQNRFFDLDEKFTLPYLHESHLIIAPEALQSKLDRSDYHHSTVRYVSTVTKMLMGYEYDDRYDYFFKSTEARYDARHAAWKDEIGSFVDANVDGFERRYTDKTISTLYIPSVVGLSYEQRITEMLQKLESHHQSLRVNLESRRGISDVFERDEPYDWLTYHKSLETSPFATDFLSKIRVFKGLTNEEDMYAVATQLGYKAHLARKRIAAKEGNVKERRTHQVYLVDKESLVAFVLKGKALLAKQSGGDRTDKISQIRASVFGKARKRVRREPLIGRIKPELISGVIRRRKFELQVCYDLALRRNQLTAGTMDWKWRVDTTGRINDIALESSTIKDRRMVECVRRKMSAWRFPRPERGSVEVNHSFSFAPRKG